MPQYSPVPHRTAVQSWPTAASAVQVWFGAQYAVSGLPAHSKGYMHVPPTATRPDHALVMHAAVHGAAMSRGAQVPEGATTEVQAGVHDVAVELDGLRGDRRVVLGDERVALAGLRDVRAAIVLGARIGDTEVSLDLALLTALVDVVTGDLGDLIADVA